MLTDPTEAEIEAARVAVLAELGQIDRTQPWGITDAEAVSIGRAALLAAAKVRSASVAATDPTIAPILAAIREALTRGYTGQALSRACSPANMTKLLAYVDALTERNRILGESVDAITAQAEDAEGRLVACRVARERAEHDADNHRTASIRSGNENYALRVRAEKAEAERAEKAERDLVTAGEHIAAWSAAVTREQERAVEAERSRDEAIRSLAEASRARGEAESKLLVSELPGIIEGWKARAEKAEAERDEARRSAHILSDQAKDSAAVILAYQETETALRAEVARLQEALTKASATLILVGVNEPIDPYDLGRTSVPNNYLRNAYKTYTIASAALASALAAVEPPVVMMGHDTHEKYWFQNPPVSSAVLITPPAKKDASHE